MNLQLYSLYVTIIMYNSSVAHTTDNTLSSTHVYSIKDSVARCSKNLSSTLNRLCDNEYKIVKRDTSVMMEKLLPKQRKEHMNNRRQSVTKKNWRRVRRQIVDECCAKPCTIGQLIMYCPEDAKLLKENPDIFYDD